jgi:DnaD/phage-associated family protein
VYAAYEQNMGLLTPMIAERLKMLVEEYSEAWLEAAIREAVVAGVHKLTYVEAVLKNWKANGFGARPAKTRPATAPAARSNGYAPPVPATTVPGETYAVGKKLSKEEHAALMARIRRENEERSKR